MKYMLLIYTDETLEAGLSEADSQAQMGEYFAFTNLVRERGILVEAEALHPTNTATTVQVRDGKTITRDGAFDKTEVQLGGFYIVDCANSAEAQEYAAKIPVARHGSVEVREIVVFG